MNFIKIKKRKRRNPLTSTFLINRNSLNFQSCMWRRHELSGLESVLPDIRLSIAKLQYRMSFLTLFADSFYKITVFLRHLKKTA